MSLSALKAKLLALLAGFLFVFFPWESFRSNFYNDRLNYFNYIEYYTNKIDYFDYSNFISYISYEWLWHFIIKVSHEDLGLSTLFILSFLSFFSFTTNFYFLSRKLGFYSSFLLLNPIFVDFVQSQLRLAFAASLALSAMMVFRHSKLVAVLLIFSTLFIHTGIIIFYIIALFCFFYKIKKIFLSPVMLVLFGLLVAFVTGPFLGDILAAMDDRRAGYSDMSAPIIYMIFWYILLFYIFLVLSKLKNKSYGDFYVAFGFVILSLIFFGSFLGVYTSRFLAAAYPFVILNIFVAQKFERYIIVSMYLLYTLSAWVFWLT
jgi:hypothetical protein